jgi:predicted anti-sigma-YlaC factor YlaD
MNNHPTQEQLIDYLHHELAPAEDAFVLAHLEGCDSCRGEYDAQTALSESLKTYGCASEREMPASVRASIWLAIDEATRPSAADRLRAWMRPALGIALATAAAIAIGVGLSPALHHGGPAAIDAMYFLDDHAAMRGSVPFNENGPAQQWLASSGASDAAVDATTH